jgi:hypothetical protein
VALEHSWTDVSKRGQDLSSGREVDSSQNRQSGKTGEIAQSLDAVQMLSRITRNRLQPHAADRMIQHFSDSEISQCPAGAEKAGSAEAGHQP